MHEKLVKSGLQAALTSWQTEYKETCSILFFIMWIALIVDTNFR
jgi:hypothetical protein